jgi:LysR family glycine cleavage system transcriptional activator
MRRLPPLNALRAFEAAARHRSFTAAAEELGVTHAAIGRHVRGLEAQLGRALFHRDGRGVVPTALGGDLARVAGEAFDTLAAGLDRLIEADVPAGRVRISLEPAFAARWLVPRLGDLGARYPRVDVVLDPTQRLVDFRRETADLAIRYSAGGPWPGTVAEKLADVEGFPVCAPALAATLATPEDLRHAILLHDESPREWAVWLAAAGAAGVDAARGTRFNDAALALEAAAHGQGVALGDSALAGDDLLAGRLVQPFVTRIAYGSYWLVMAEGRRLSPAAGAFRAWIGDAMAAFLAGLGKVPPASILPDEEQPVRPVAGLEEGGTAGAVVGNAGQRPPRDPPA